MDFKIDNKVLFCILLVVTFFGTLQGQSNDTNTTSEPNTFTYEQLNNMRRWLEAKLTKIAKKSKGNSSNHMPPGGSKVMSDDYLTPGMIYIKTNVHVVVSVSRIDFMNVDSQTLTFAAEVALGWLDTNLKWNYSLTDFPIYNIVMNPELIWTPNLLPLDLIGYDYIPSSVQPSVTVFPSGAVISKVRATVVAPCDVEVLTYPFDRHHCHLKFTQAFNPGARINFIAVPASDKSKASLYFNYQHRHREWDLVSLNSSSVNDGDYYQLEIVVRRKAVFYAIVLIMPCVVLNLLSFLMFVIEVDGTGRVELTLNLILSFFVLLIILVDSIPPSGGDVPLLGLYVTVSTVVVVFMMTGSLLLIELNNMKISGKAVPGIFEHLTKKFKLKMSKPGVNKVDAANNNPANGKKMESDQELAPLATMDKPYTEAKQDSFDENNEAKMDAVIYNLNLILFVITLIIHIVLLVGVSVTWVCKAS